MISIINAVLPSMLVAYQLFIYVNYYIIRLCFFILITFRKFCEY